MASDNQSMDSTAFTAFFQRYKNRTYSFALKMLGDAQAAGDVTQEAFVRLYESGDHDSGIRDVKCWLFITVRNLCLNKIRDGRKHSSLTSAVESAGGDEFADPRHRAVRKALAALDTNHREALILREYQGFSYQEIADILNLSLAAVKSLLYRARCRLKEEYDELNTEG